MTLEQFKKYKPTIAEVEKYNKMCYNDKKFSKHDEILVDVFRQYPTNKNINGVLIKATLLNTFYGTYIRDTFRVAEHIAGLSNVDVRIKNGDLTVVEDIAKTPSYRFYSFATKYCSFHNPEKFPIYDSFVHNVLWSLKKRDNFYQFKSCELHDDYGKFVGTIDAFMKYYGLQKFWDTYKSLCFEVCI